MSIPALLNELRDAGHTVSLDGGSGIRIAPTPDATTLNRVRIAKPDLVNLLGAERELDLLPVPNPATACSVARLWRLANHPAWSEEGDTVRGWAREQIAKNPPPASLGGLILALETRLDNRGATWARVTPRLAEGTDPDTVGVAEPLLGGREVAAVKGAT